MLEKVLKEYPAFRLKQAKHAIFKELMEDWQAATVLPQVLRDELDQKYPLKLNTELNYSHDKKTIKALLTLLEGGKVETVLMRHKDRNTVCVSSQIGCPMGCDFCATGKMGLIRNLTSEEIINQILLFARLLKKEQQKLTNVVFMGMGEPLLNYEEVWKAILIMNDKDGFEIGARKISISTCGIPDGIRKLSQAELQINLALSLHAPNDKLRNKLMPVNLKFSINEVLNAVSDYIEKTNRKVMIEYVMLKAVNDSEKQAGELADLLNNKLQHLFMVNLIAYNETDQYQSTAAEQIHNFRNVLEDEGITVIQRFRFGREIKGACGQLATERN